MTMKLSKYKIKKNKFWFIILCVVFFAGIGCITKITDLMIETSEIEAKVVHTYVSHNVKHASHGKPKMNIEWVDRSGNQHVEGNLLNKNHLVVGDTYTILVDAKTHSRRILSKSGNIIMICSGIFLCIVCLGLVKAFFMDDLHLPE